MNCNGGKCCIIQRDQIKESRGSVEAVGESNVNKLGVEGQVRIWREIDG